MPVNYSCFPLHTFLFVFKSAQEGREAETALRLFFFKGERKKKITPKWKKKNQLHSTCSLLYTPSKRACQLKPDFLPPKEIFRAICC